MIFENPFKYRRKGERRKTSRVFVFLIAVVVLSLCGFGVALYFTALPDKTAEQGDVPKKSEKVDKEAYLNIQKNKDITAHFFTPIYKSIQKNPDQIIIDERIQKLKILPPLSDKTFFHSASVPKNNIIQSDDLKSNIQGLDVVFPDWFRLTVSTCTIFESIDWNQFELFSKNNSIIIPRFSNTNPFGETIDFGKILYNEKESECLINTLKWYVKNRSVKGINIDIKNLEDIHRDAYTVWLLNLVESFHIDSLYVIVNIPLNNGSYDYLNIGRIVDMIAIKAYDENSMHGSPGPVAGIYWLEHSLDTLFKILPPSKTIIDLGVHGYDWNMSTGTIPEKRDYERTIRLIENQKVPILWDRESYNNSFSYVADDGDYHESWFLDAVSMWNQHQTILQKGFAGVSFEWMGNEDASIWKIIHTRNMAAFDPKFLNIVTKEWSREVIFTDEIATQSDYTYFPKESTISENPLFGITKDIFFPFFSIGERISMLWKNILPKIKQWSWNFIVVLFFFTTAVSVFRIIFLGYFVFRSSSYKKKYFPKIFISLPPVTILVPAYNEEKVIERTIIGLMSSEYKTFEILIIDDGSTDKTAMCVKNMIKKYSNVRLITKKNEGKSLALNVGFKEAQYDYVITVDADTIVLPKTIYYLMEPFSDKSVDAVCGNIGVGNVKNILTAFQEVEYVTGQNFDRRAFDALNCISVVPGATGAWKKRKVIDIGGYSSDTLVEDADLTLTLLENGGRIVYAPLARSVTEAPEIVGALFKQRFRWSYGTFQCFWKHRKTFGKGTLGWIALPNMLFFQVIFPALSPIGDLVLFLAIFFGNPEPILMAYVLFIFLDAIVSGAAYALDKKSMANIWVIGIQRFFYRQFMYTVTFKSIFAAIVGSHHGWNKLERKGTVSITETMQ